MLLLSFLFASTVATLIPKQMKRRLRKRNGSFLAGPMHEGANRSRITTGLRLDWFLGVIR